MARRSSPPVAIATAVIVAVATVMTFSAVAAAAILQQQWHQPAFAQEHGGGSEGGDDEHVDFVANIEHIRGHLEQAVANKQANNPGLAKAHAGHPIAEHYSLIEVEVEEHDEALNTQLKGALTALSDQADALSTSDFEARVGEVNGMLDRAVQSVIGATERNDPKFNAKVIMVLLEVAEHEYEEAVENGEITEMVEYQDATGFISRAKAVFSTIESDVPEHEAEEIVEFFEDLDGLVESKASAGEVETVIGGISHELEEALGLEQEAEEEIKGWEYIDRIGVLLDQSIAEYKKGEYAEARALAVEAYLDNYEHIEADIEEDDPGLMEKIEIDLREELADMIDARKPAGEIEAHIATIKSDLETARTVVVPEFSLAAGAALAAVAAAIIAGTVYARTRSGGNWSPSFLA